LKEIQRGNVRGKKGKEAQTQNASRRREAIQDYLNWEGATDALGQAAPAGDEESKPDAPSEEIGGGKPGGRGQRPQDAAVRLKSSDVIRES
jgi:hypothetical protein